MQAIEKKIAESRKVIVAVALLIYSRLALFPVSIAVTELKRAKNYASMPSLSQ